MDKIKIEYRSVDELIPYANNPRDNSGAVDAVAESIKEYGFKNPIVIDKNNVIIAGHTRLLASEQLGLEEIPTIKAEDLDSDQVKAFRVADNKTSEFADWDIKQLNKELEEIGDMFTAFYVSEEEMFKSVEEADTELEEYEEPVEEVVKEEVYRCPDCRFEGIQEDFKA